MIRFSDDFSPGAGVDMLIQPSRVELNALHPSLRFSGDWGISADDDARVFGQCTIGDSATPMRASLSMQAADDGLTVLLQAVDGRVVMGPARLRLVRPDAVAIRRREAPVLITRP